MPLLEIIASGLSIVSSLKSLFDDSHEVEHTERLRRAEVSRRLGALEALVASQPTNDTLVASEYRKLIDVLRESKGYSAKLEITAGPNGVWLLRRRRLAKRTALRDPRGEYSIG